MQLTEVSERIRLPHLKGRCTSSFQKAPSKFGNLRFYKPKSAFLPNPVCPRSKKRRLLKRLFSIFWKFGIFSKFKGAFFLNWASALYPFVKGAFFSKSMDFQLSPEKKINSIFFLVNFFEKFKIEHKIHFSSWFPKIWKFDKTPFFLHVFYTS